MENCYRGYGRFNNYKAWYNLEGNLLIENVFADHLYCDTEETFDRHGNVIGSHTVNHRQVEEVKVMKHNNLWPIQIGYEFYLIDIYKCSTMDDLYLMSASLNNSNLGKFDVKPHFTYRGWDDEYKINFIPYECSTKGATREIIRKSFNEFISLDYLEYTEKYNSFVSKLEDYKDYQDYKKLDIARTYKTNIEIASYFYNVPEEKIITNNFNRPQKLIERLEKKINHKHREQIKKNKYN
jgi:hypothetical protein